jgi:predicted Zn-dependent protease
MKTIRILSLFALVTLLGAVTVEAQLLKKLKKAADTAVDVAEEVDRFTFDEDEEIELGEAISYRIRARYGVTQDLEATRYLSLVGLTIAAQSGRADLPWHWVILDSSAINAFAAPGGFVHVTRGALAVMKSEAELASVLAHEVGHITRKHTLKGLQKSMGMELAQNQADFAAGSSFFDAVADKATQAVLAGFGQAEELEADEVGIQFAAQAGYQPGGLGQFLFTLDDLSSASSSKVGLFRSHPDTEERIENASRQIAQQGLERGVWLEDRFESEVAYEMASASTGGPTVDGARGMAGSADQAGEESGQESTEDTSDEKEDQAGGRFSLAQLATDPFAMGSEEESSEVTGAGAGRAMGEEDTEVEGGPKNTRFVEIEISPAELAAFRQEGGLP